MRAAREPCFWGGGRGGECPSGKEPRWINLAGKSAHGCRRSQEEVAMEIFCCDRSLPASLMKGLFEPRACPPPFSRHETSQRHKETKTDRIRACLPKGRGSQVLKGNAGGGTSCCFALLICWYERTSPATGGPPRDWSLPWPRCHSRILLGGRCS